jgi:transcriptional regulator with XRE-family HTH domain
MIYPPPIIHMTREDLYLWRVSQCISKRRAAIILGVARNTYAAYESGRHPIPRYIWLACERVSGAAIPQALDKVA